MKTKTLKTILCLSFACLSCEPKIETAYIKASKAKIFDSNGKVAGYLPYGYSVKGAYSFQKFVISREGLYLQKQDTTIEEKNIKDPQLYMQLKYDTGDLAANINKTDMKFFRDQMTYFEYWRYAPSGDMRKIEGRGKTEFDGGDIKITYSGEKFEGQEFDQEYGKRNAFRNTKLHLKFINTLGIYVEQSQKSKIDRVTCKIDTKTCEVQCNKFIGPLEANSEINSRYQACLKSDGDTDCDDVIYDKIHGYCIQ